MPIERVEMFRASDGSLYQSEVAARAAEKSHLETRAADAAECLSTARERVRLTERRVLEAEERLENRKRDLRAAREELELYQGALISLRQRVRDVDQG